MKNKKILFVPIFICSLFLTGCSLGDTQLNNKYMGDRSEYMPVVPMDDTKYSANIVQKLSPIVNNGYTLQTQAIAIKNGRANRIDELQKIDNMLLEVQNVRDYLGNITVSDSKEESKNGLIAALDKYSVELKDYKNLLSQESITKDQLQQKIDEVVNALSTVKVYLN